MVADGGPDRPSGWAAGRVTHFLTQTLACMHEVHSGALRPLPEALKECKTKTTDYKPSSRTVQMVVGNIRGVGA